MINYIQANQPINLRKQMTGLPITMLGCGAWGGTIAHYLDQLGHSVTAWSKFPEEIDQLHSSRKHPFISDLVFPDSIRFTSDVHKSLTDARIIVIAIPSHSVRDLLKEVNGLISDAVIIVNLSKGIENNTMMTMSQVIADEGKIEPKNIVTLYGPSHAEEVALRMPTTLVAAGSSVDSAVFVQDNFSSETLRIYTTSDILGVELGGSVKNVIAIAAGIIDGIGFGDNTKAALITRGISEITRLGEKMGANPDTFSGLSGVGDLIVTCLSKHSRNRYVGEEIGKGRTLKKILDGMEMVAEGVKTTESVYQLQKKHTISMPISTAVYNVLYRGKNAQKEVKELMTRDLTIEKRY